jgi:uracil-DNA glycosylase family 4
MTPGIGGRRIRGRAGGAKRCVLVVGESPGILEDKTGEVFVGPSGQLLQRSYLRAIPEDTDVWATNAVKCAKPYNGNVLLRHVRRCQKHLWEDISNLVGVYDDVWVLCVGGVAARAVLGVTRTSDAFRRQGELLRKLPFDGRPLPGPVRVFATFHPAYLLRENKRTLEAVVADHLRLMELDIRAERFGHKPVQTTRVPLAEFEDQLYGARGMGLLCLDIETYGILKGRRQGEFNPHASYHLDGVPYRRQLVSIALSFPLLGGGVVATAAIWNEETRAQVGRILKRAQGRTLLGTNLLFDLSYLSVQFPMIDWREYDLEDLCVLAWLQNPDRVELGLKDLTPLILPLEGMIPYAYQKGIQFSNADDLLEYNVQDVVNPLLIREALRRRMHSAGWPQHPDETIQFYSREVLPTVLTMATSGICIDAGRLSRAQKEQEDKCARAAEAGRRQGFLLRGKGSGLAVQDLFAEVIRLAPEGTRFELTKGGDTSTKDENLKTAIELDLPRMMKWKLKLTRWFRGRTKILTAYLRPLERATMGAQTGKVLVFPSWFPVPSRWEDDSKGGTRQSRVTCRRPAPQTAPIEIKRLFNGRYKDGRLENWDYNQLELRVMALASGDPFMLRVYQEGRDFHHETLEGILGRKVSKEEPGYDRLRRVAKMRNFGILYGLSAPGLVDLMWREASIRLPEGEAIKAVHGFKRLCPGVVSWQGDRLREVVEKGRLALPITGQWLSFTPPIAGEEPDKAIFNFPIQGTAANIALVGQNRVQKILAERHWGCSPLNVYDSALVELRPGVPEEGVREMVRAMECNWFTEALWEHFGRKVPFPVDRKVLRWQT